MSNIWEKVTYLKLRFSKPRNFVARSNFQTSCCNLKCRSLRAKLWVTFLLFSFQKELWCFEVKDSMPFVEQKYKVWQKRDEIKNGKSYTQFLRDKPCTSARIRIAD